MNTVLPILILIVAIVVQVVIATKFGAIAEEKGYDYSPYFWLCFFLGGVGYIMVAALPDRTLRGMLRDLSAKTAAPCGETNSGSRSYLSGSGASATPPANGWKCGCGRVHASYVTSCVCGKTKRDAMINKQ